MTAAQPSPPPQDRVLTGRTALVTGAGQGLGREIALALGAAGAEVVCVGRDPVGLEAVVAELHHARARALARTCDVSDAADVARLAAGLEGIEISILVNNAGIGGPVSDLVDIDQDAWDEVFAVNVRGVFLMCRAFLPPMVARGEGDVINIASVTGKRPLPGRTPYAASKTAVIGLTTTLAFEVGDAGVRVNAISPGPVESERMTRNFRLEAERTGITIAQAEEAFVSRAAFHRMLRPEEVGAAVVAVLQIPALTGADIDLSAGMIGR